jgi:hypothetical protein
MAITIPVVVCTLLAAVLGYVLSTSIGGGDSGGDRAAP